MTKLARVVRIRYPLGSSQTRRAWFIGGTLVTAMIVWSQVAPATMHCRERSKAEIANARVHQLAYDAFPMWRDAHLGARCPASPAELIPYTNELLAIDPWGRELRLACDARGIIVWSVGEDGLWGTDDDITSRK